MPGNVTSIFFYNLYLFFVSMFCYPPVIMCTFFVCTVWLWFRIRGRWLRYSGWRCLSSWQWAPHRFCWGPSCRWPIKPGWYIYIISFLSVPCIKNYMFCTLFITYDYNGCCKSSGKLGRLTKTITFIETNIFQKITH